MSSVAVILCDCVTCTCLSYCNIVALYNCYRVETHLQFKPIIITVKMDLREIGWGGVDWIDMVRIGTS
jgi:hypothetical protein